MRAYVVGVSINQEWLLRSVPLGTVRARWRHTLTNRRAERDRSQQASPYPPHEVTHIQTCGVVFCIRLHASAAANRLEMAGCEWKNHSTHLEGVRSARFCSASLFIEEMKGSTLGIDSNAYRSACRSLNREYALSAGINKNESTAETSASSGKLAKSDNSSNICWSTA